MITFECLTEENLYIAKEMIISNTSYLEKEYGKSQTEEVDYSLLTSNQCAFLIKVEDTYIGLTSFKEHHEEQLVSIDLMIIHADYQGYGYGTTAYYELENLFLKRGFEKIVLNVSCENNRAGLFWERNGFTATGKMIDKGMNKISYEKHLS